MLTDNKKFKKILLKIDEEILNGELTDIIEVTYAYKKIGKGLYWNETLFGHLGGFSYKNIESYSNIYTITHNRLKDKIKSISNICHKVIKLSNLSEKNKLKRNILLGSLQYSVNCLKISSIGLPFELEKAGVKHYLSKKSILKNISKIESLEKNNFGGKIVSNSEELIIAYNYLKSVYNKNINKLSTKEKKEFEFHFLKTVRGYIPKGSKISSVNFVDKKRENEPYLKESPKFKRILLKKVSRKKYTKIFNVILNDYLGLNFNIIHDERSSIYDGPGYLAIPISSDYDSLSYRRIIELIGHEIEVHCYNYSAGKSILGSFRGAGNLEKEEGFAMVIEEFLGGKKLEQISVTKHFIRVLAAEIFPTIKLKKFLKLYSKLEGVEYSNRRLLRLKRNYPLGYKGSQHKDATYGRGIQKVLRFLKKGGDMRELYLGKVSIEDLPKVKRLLKLEGTDITSMNIPIFLGELFYYILMMNAEGVEYGCYDFLRYLKDKYHFINFDKLDLPIIREFVKINTLITTKILKL